MSKGVSVHSPQIIARQRNRFRMVHEMMPIARIIGQEQQMRHCPGAAQTIVAQVEFLQVNANRDRHRSGRRHRRRPDDCRCSVAVALGQQIAGEQQEFELRQTTEQIG